MACFIISKRHFPLGGRDWITLPSVNQSDTNLSWEFVLRVMYLNALFARGIVKSTIGRSRKSPELNKNKSRSCLKEAEGKSRETENHLEGMAPALNCC